MPKINAFTKFNRIASFIILLSLERSYASLEEKEHDFVRSLRGNSAFPKKKNNVEHENYSAKTEEVVDSYRRRNLIFGGSTDSVLKYGDVLFFQSSYMDLRWLSGGRGLERKSVITSNYYGTADENNSVAPTYTWTIWSVIPNEAHTKDPKQEQDKCIRYGDAVYIRNMASSDRWLSSAWGENNGIVTSRDILDGQQISDLLSFQWTISSDERASNTTDPKSGLCIQDLSFTYLQNNALTSPWLSAGHGERKEAVFTRNIYDFNESTISSNFKWRIQKEKIGNGVLPNGSIEWNELWSKKLMRDYVDDSTVTVHFSKAYGLNGFDRVAVDYDDTENACYIVSTKPSVHVEHDLVGNMDWVNNEKYGSANIANSGYEKSVKKEICHWVFKQYFPVYSCETVEEKVLVPDRGYTSFVEAFNEVEDLLETLVMTKCRLYGATKFTYIGYSRGGAIAQIAALQHFRKGITVSSDDVWLVTYNSPNALDPWSSNALSEYLDGTLNIVRYYYLEQGNVTDIVANLPPRFSKPGGNNRMVECSGASSYISLHQCGGRISRLEANVERDM